MNQDLDIGMLLGYVLTSHELWDSSCEGILCFACYGLLLGALLSTWVFELCFLRGALRFASCVGICDLLLAWVFVLCFLRGYLRFARFLNVNDRQLAVNGRQCFLACFARYGRQCFVGIARNAR